MDQNRDADLDMGARLFFLIVDSGLLAWIGADFFGTDPEHDDFGTKIICFLGVLLLTLAAASGVFKKFRAISKRTLASDNERDGASA